MLPQVSLSSAPFDASTCLRDLEVAHIVWLTAKYALTHI